MASAFQVNAFQNNVAGNTKGFQVEAPLNIVFKSCFVDSTMELPADSFNAEIASPTTLFTNATSASKITIALGLMSACVGGTPQTISHIRDGFIDEYELHVTPNEQTIRIRGRDPAAAALDCEFNKIYVRAKYLNNGVLSDETQSEINGMAAKTIKFVDGTVVQIPAKVQGIDWQLGTFTAKQIATEALAQEGLTLLWEVRNYTLQNTFNAQGRIIETLRKLVEPWTQVEAFRADIFIQGKQVVVRHRQLPGQVITPQYTFDVAAMRRGEITVRKRPIFPVGRLTLVGQLQQIQTNFVTVVGDDGEDLVDVEQTTVVPPTGSDTTSKKIVTKTRYQMPQQIVVRQFKDVYAPQKVEHTEVFNDYIDTDVGKLLSVSRTTTQKWDESISSLADFERTTIFNTYDDDTFLLRNQTSVFEQVDPLISTYVASKMITKVIYDVAPNMVEERTTEYAPSAGMSDGADAAAGSAFWDIVRQDSQIQAGHRAGGSGRKTIFIPNFPGSTTNIEIFTNFFPNDRCLATKVYSNENLSMQDLLFLKTLFVAANNFDFEWELSFQGVAVPWLQKGVTLQITGLVGPDGVAITLPPVFITEVRSTYDESMRDAKYVTQVRAFTWQ